MHQLVLLLVTAAPEQLVFREWYAGDFPGAFGRTTVTLTTSGAEAVIAFEHEEPPKDQRGRSNATGFERKQRVEVAGTVTKSGGRVTYSFAKTDTPAPFVLDCAPVKVPVHAAAAQLERDAMCDCDELPRCSAQARAWRPAGTKQMSVFSCTAKAVAGGWPPLPGVLSMEEPLVFSAAPGLERLRGPGDCPVTGLREARQPTIDWSVFPEGSTALRLFRARLAASAEYETTSVVIHRRGAGTTITRGGERFVAAALDAPATNGAHTFALSCWKETRTIHSKDLRFSLPSQPECDGGDELATSSAPAKTTLLACRTLVDGAATDTVLPFVAGRVIEDLDIDADCTLRRALRFIPSVDSVPFKTD